MKKAIIMTAASLMLVGCGHNINVQGFGFACPYGALGYGTFSCTKDNVTVKSTEKTTADGIETINEFKVGKQTTGYDVELEKVKKEMEK
ncbi:MAG: hypothetical protein IKB71_02500 [Lentisphaeria bacterium]|nr:hypothetical protein [Lentisphaeria bacterium]